MRWPAVLLLFFLAGCRGCSDGERGNPGPPMPKGMLVPAPSSSAVAVPRGDYALHRERLAGGVELRPAAATDTERSDLDGGATGSVYLSLDAMTVFHDAFARAYQPGTFDLFVPRIVDGKALAAELRSLLESLAPSTAREALGRAGAELIQFAEARERVWVLTL